MSQNKFISDFQNELKKVKNEQYFIKNEINQIENFINTERKISFSTSFLGDVSINKPESVFDLEHLRGDVFFSEMFNQYIKYGEINIESDFNIDLEDLKKLVIEFVEYYEWLMELKPNKPKSEFTLTLNQKLLLLHYLGFDNLKYANTDIGEVIFLLLGMDRNKDNLRKNLSHISAGKNKVRTKANFNKLKQLFDNHNLIELSNRVQKDLENHK